MLSGIEIFKFFVSDHLKSQTEISFDNFDTKAENKLIGFSFWKMLIPLLRKRFFVTLEYKLFFQIFYFSFSKKTTCG